MDLSHLKYHIVLGSQSPRRKELLSALDVSFTIEVPNIEEIYPKDIELQEIPAFLAQLKLNHLLASAKDNTLYICSDTVVLLGNQVLEKPKDAKDARKMLRSLSGQNHTVITSVAMGSKTKTTVFSDRTEVSFMRLNEEDISYYIEQYKPFDKAGSYGVQDWIGMMAIEKISGSFYTVMGLPTHLVYQELKNWE